MNDTIASLARAWSEHVAQMEQDRRILVVDDDDAMRELFVATLTDAGFECQSAGTAMEALRLFRTHRFDAVVVDKNLPDTTGVNFIRRVQKFDRNCEAILVTAFANLESVLAAIELRAVAYLTKPLDHISILPATLERALKRRRRRLQVRRMVEDLKVEVELRAGAEDRSLLTQLRESVTAFKKGLAERRRLLVSDLDARNMVWNVDYAREQGFDVIVEKSARTALERCTRSRLQVALLSEGFIDMPGLEFFERLSELSGRPEVVFAGAFDGHGSALRALSQGASAAFTLPIRDDNAFVWALRRACEDHHERMYEFKLVSSLQEVLAKLEARDVHFDAITDVSRILNEFDVTTAKHAVDMLES